ncbi:hypothetical protein QBC35DRAFT_263270 [Podospora australis]|uniref:Uncharacterized protein n=1 Tax=Podospora australis TaxID=1536484 RepID=A0AAN6X4S8_9PEZI|nr:hypothetical protein QBC35DRAFT_263270 [Podospora australis]
MDDAARLVSELHDKLAELDGKVAAYRRDMLAEFHRYMDECLKAYPDHVSEQVSRVIADTISRYSALSPTTPRDSPDSPAIDHKTWKGRKSPPPVLRHTSGVPKEGPRSPHQREKEFQGLFTPTYLPLLENNDRNHRPSPPSTTAPAPTETTKPTPLLIDNVKKVEEIQAPVKPAEGRPLPVRRLTDLSSSSVESSSSESKIRRSALRRTSSSSNRGSPRRVRFELTEGEEVLPSSSPKASIIPAVAGKAEPQAVVAPLETAVEDESPDPEYTGISLLDVEGEEDFLPRPKKVSSTQALQALTRSPVEDGSFWTVVNPDGEMNGQKEANIISDKPPVKSDSQSTIRATDGSGDSYPANGLLGSPMQKGKPFQLDSDDSENSDDESEEEFLSMKPKKKSPSPGAQLPFRPPAAQPQNSAPTVNGRGSTSAADDAVFDLEEDQEAGETSKYISDDDDDEEELEVRLRPHRSVGMLPKSAEVPTTLPPVSPSIALFSHSIGSYKGNPIILNPIKDPDLYDNIANMKDVHFFVGSVDGRSGTEAADMGSYRALSKVNQVEPRSFTERLAMEEAMERRRHETGLDDVDE